MLLNPKTPLIFGIIALVFLSVYLYVHDPLPDALTLDHQQVIPGTDINSCEKCHTPEGFVSSCIKCHIEIGEQLDSKQGYHGFLAEREDFDCSTCHPEHHGESFPLVSSLSWQGEDPNTFDHPHCSYELEGYHDKLTCTECHLDKLTKEFSLPGFPEYSRMSTFLGLTQDCLACHVDVHAWPSKRSCLSCHNQNAFTPASKFEHKDVFILEGEHAIINCEECHLVNTTDNAAPAEMQQVYGSLPFYKVTGETCEQCHKNPHRTNWNETCESCHFGRDMEWSEGLRGIDTIVHETTGFALTGAHLNIACQECHPVQKDYNQRYPDPKAQGYQRQLQTCQGCHEDVHKGEFNQACTVCHQTSGWHDENLLFNHDKDTEFALDAVHKNLSCDECHSSGDMTFAAKGTECADCHEVQINAMRGLARNTQTEPDPHYNRVSCIECHEMDNPNQSIANYARNCAECHNDQYIQLAFEWSQTLENQYNSVELLIDNASEISKQIQSDLSEAVEIGFHNLKLTRQIYSRILQIVKKEKENEKSQKEANF